MPQTLSPLRIGAVALLLAAPAFGQAPQQTYALSWVRAEGTEECPPVRELIAEVERRLGRPVFDARASRAYEVEVTRFGKVFRSDVFVRGENGESLGHRTLQTDEPGCQALLDATALAIALSIDPEAASRKPEPKPSAPPEPPVVAEAPPLPPPLPAPVCPVAPACTKPEPQPPATPVTMLVRGQLALGLVPGVAPGLEARFGAEPWGAFGLALSVAYAAPQNAARGLGSLDVGLTRATLLGTVRAASSERLRLTLGTGPSLGAFHVAVREPAPVTNPGDFWFATWALGASMEASVTKRVFVSLGAEGDVALRRQEFLVRGEQQAVWRQPWVAGAFSLGVAVTFP